MKDVVVRALKTFIQAAISYVCTISFIDIDWSDNTVVGGVILAALAAGISALMNIDWDAISLEKAAEEVDEAEDAADADALDEESEDVDYEEEDADADESAEEEDTGFCAAEADAEDADVEDVDTVYSVTTDDDASDEDTTETETEKACG